MIKEDMIEAVRVMFIKQIHEDDFPEKGMIVRSVYKMRKDIIYFHQMTF